MLGSPTPDRDAEFSEFVRSASAPLTRTAYLISGDRDTAAELVQEALVRTYVAWRRVRRDGAAAYARRALVNLNIDRWRRRAAVPSDPAVTLSPAGTEWSSAKLSGSGQVVFVAMGEPSKGDRGPLVTEVSYTDADGKRVHDRNPSPSR